MSTSPSNSILSFMTNGLHPSHEHTPNSPPVAPTDEIIQAKTMPIDDIDQIAEQLWRSNRQSPLPQKSEPPPLELPESSAPSSKKKRARDIQASDKVEAFELTPSSLFVDTLESKEEFTFSTDRFDNVISKATSYLENGEYYNAKKWFKIALKIDPSSETAQQGLEQAEQEALQHKKISVITKKT